MNVRYYKIYPHAHDPVLSTEGSACFDLKASITDDSIKLNGGRDWRTPVDGIFELYPGEVALIPTGLVFDLYEGTSMRIHSRSGLSWKHGVVLKNQEGIIDSDYVEEVFLMLQNSYPYTYVVKDGDKIAQAEIVKSPNHTLLQINSRPDRKTSRNGGFGSTGK